MQKEQGSANASAENWATTSQNVGDSKKQLVEKKLQLMDHSQ